MAQETAAGSSVLDRAQAALAAVRPYIESDGGDVWLIKIEERVAFVQMLGACGGCAASHQTLKFTLERAIKERCPEIDRVEQI